MIPSRVTPDQIARTAGLSVKYVRRRVRGAQGVGRFSGREWFGARMRVFIGECGPEVAFSTLPDPIREAFVMLDQMEFPFSGFSRPEKERER